MLQQSCSVALGEEIESSSHLGRYLGFVEHCLDCFARFVESLARTTSSVEFHSWHALRSPRTLYSDIYQETLVDRFTAELAVESGLEKERRVEQKVLLTLISTASGARAI